MQGSKPTRLDTSGRRRRSAGSRRIGAAVTGVIVLLLLTPTQAAPLGAGWPPSLTAKLARANAARDAGRWPDAVSLYKDALDEAERAGVPWEESAFILGELGLSELRTNQHVDAANHLSAALGGLFQKPKLTDSQAVRYMNGREDARRQCASLSIHITPTDAEVTVAGNRLPLPRWAPTIRDAYLEPGSYLITARLDGFENTRRVVTLGRGMETLVEIKLLPRLAQREPSVVTSPATPRVQPRSSEDITSVFRVGAFVTAGIGAAVGAGLLIATIPVNDSVEDHMNTFGTRYGYRACNGPAHEAECNAQEERVNTRAWLTGGGWTALGVSGMLGAVAASSYLWTDDQGTAPVRVSVIATGEHAGAILLGTW